tara:strand:+ start:834 stop:2201 length:1368 start_codon:yes stop_codon:yes gene_type:complete
MGQKIGIPKGTRDFLPQNVLKRNYIFNTIKSIFELNGFSPIETPSFELNKTLLGKYGEEGDRLIFRIMNSGEKVKKADSEALQNNELGKFVSSLSEKSLRYDLTVPFARFVVQHQNDLPFPFKRYQIQPVWRADRPQHGRYQEFYQCDADVIGSESLWHEINLLQIIDKGLSKLNIPSFTIHLNNRKILSGIAEICDQQENIIDITQALDKLDKIGEEGVIKEFEKRNIPEKAINLIKPLFQLSGTSEEKLAVLKSYLKNSEIGLKGIDEMEFIIEKINLLGLDKAKLNINVTLARGLNYYTGSIIEVTADDIKMGSICGGGRYDDLTGLFGLKDLSGVGISFGADRIYDILETLDLFPKELSKGVKILFVNMGEKETEQAMVLANQLKENGISCEVYADAAKLAKQMKYANKLNVEYVAVIGANELSNKTVQLKNMSTGDQDEFSWNELSNALN